VEASLWDGSGEEESDGQWPEKVGQEISGEDLGGKALIFMGVFDIVMVAIFSVFYLEIY